jgi:hypothetical protein
MKASELIQILHKLTEDHGDHEAIISVIDGWPDGSFYGPAKGE